MAFLSKLFIWLYLLQFCGSGLREFFWLRVSGEALRVRCGNRRLDWSWKSHCWLPEKLKVVTERLQLSHMWPSPRHCLLSSHVRLRERILKPLCLGTVQVTESPSMHCVYTGTAHRLSRFNFKPSSQVLCAWRLLHRSLLMPFHLCFVLPYLTKHREDKLRFCSLAFMVYLWLAQLGGQEG